MQAPLLIRTYQPTDAQAVRDLFLTVTRELIPDHLDEARDAYLAYALKVELDWS